MDTHEGRDDAREHVAAELRRLATALDAAGEAVMITDRDGTIEYVNRQFVRQTGYRGEEAIGRRPSILKSGVQDAGFYLSLIHI